MSTERVGHNDLIGRRRWQALGQGLRFTFAKRGGAARLPSLVDAPLGTVLSRLHGEMASDAQRGLLSRRCTRRRNDRHCPSCRRPGCGDAGNVGEGSAADLVGLLGRYPEDAQQVFGHLVAGLRVVALRLVL